MSTPNTPLNTNIAQRTKFTLTFLRNPNMVFWCTKTNIPGIQLDVLTRPTPLVNLKEYGRKLEFGPLRVRFIIDEDWLSWTEIFNWMTGLAPPETTDEYSNMLAINAQLGGARSDATVTMYNNDNTPNRRITYYNVFPFSLVDVDLDTESSADDIVIADASFAYDYYQFQSV